MILSYFSQQKKSENWIMLRIVSISWITSYKAILNAKHQKSNIHILKEAITSRPRDIGFLWYAIKIHEFILIAYHEHY